jgi:hypothetical protein
LPNRIYLYASPYLLLLPPPPLFFFFFFFFLSLFFSIYVRIDESVVGPARPAGAVGTTGAFHCHLRGLDLSNALERGFLGLGAIDPYYVVSKRRYFVDGDGASPPSASPSSSSPPGTADWIPAYRSERKRNTINPHWRPWSLDMERLCHFDAARWELRIDVWDHEDGGGCWGGGRRGGGGGRDRWIGTAGIGEDHYAGEDGGGEGGICVETLMAHVTEGGNADRGRALRIFDDARGEVGMIVILRAEIVGGGGGGGFF